MTVGELCEALENFDPTVEVFLGYSDADTFPVSIEGVETNRIKDVVLQISNAECVGWINPMDMVTSK